MTQQPFTQRSSCNPLSGAAYRTVPAQPTAPMQIARTPPRLSTRDPARPPAPAPTPDELLKAYKSTGTARRGISRLDFNPKGMHTRACCTL